MKFYPVYQDECAKKSRGSSSKSHCGTGTTDERGVFSTKEKWANFTPCPTAKWSPDPKASIQYTKPLHISWNIPYLLLSLWCCSVPDQIL